MTRTVTELMTASVPKARSDETAGAVLERLREDKPDEASHLYLIDEASILTGQVPIERLIAAAPGTLLGSLRGDPPIVATLIASLLPWMLDRLGVDPAMASGPVATVLQDLLSVAIYLGIATAII